MLFQNLSILMMLSVIPSLACKSKSMPAKTSPVQATEAGDDESINIPKELETTVALSYNEELEKRSKFQKELVEKNLSPQERLEVTTRGVRELRFALDTQLAQGPLRIELKGSSIKTVMIEKDQKEFSIPLSGKLDEKVQISIAQLDSSALPIKSFSTDEGSILEWSLGPK